MSPLLRLSPRLALATLACAGIAVSCGCDGERNVEHSGRVTILAAASAKEAIEEIAAEHEQATGVEVDVSLGGSNALAQQILAGAPADLFLSASEEWAQALAKEGLVAERTDLLTNRLVLVVPSGNPAGVHAPHDLLGKGVERVAIAAENVPAGTYAEQALTTLDLFEKLNEAGKVARGHDVRATLAFVERGEADAGVVYATDALVAGGVEPVYAFDPALHDEIVYPLALLADGASNPAAKELFDRLRSPASLEAFRRRGFDAAPIGQAPAGKTATDARRP